MLTHLSLFSGIGGIDLAAEQAGFTTVGQCEFADYPTKVLEKHWPDVPRWRDVRHVKRRKVIGKLYKRGLLRDGKLAIDLISGGIPCQPFSVAGKQKGKGDDRHLWPEMLRVIRELKPCWVLIENVPGILRITADDICKDLECEGYDVGIFDYEAAAVGASHRRERVFFVANARCALRQRSFIGDANEIKTRKGNADFDKRPSEISEYDVANANLERKLQPKGCNGEVRGRPCDSNEAVANADYEGLQIARHEPRIERILTGNGIEHSGSVMADTEGERLERYYIKSTSVTSEPNGTNTGATHGIYGGEQRSTQSRLGGMADGLPGRLDGVMTFPSEPDIPRTAKGVINRVDRLKCLGNAVVPAQVFPILRAIAGIERGMDYE